MRVKIVSRGWDRFTGRMGAWNFVDGISDDVGRGDVDRIAAVVRVVEIDEDGNELGQVGPAMEQVKNKGTAARVVPRRRRASEIEAEEQAKAQATAPEAAPPADIEPPQGADKQGDEGQDGTADADADADADGETEGEAGGQTPGVRYTQEQLEDIADKTGIIGLREIAEPYGIKSNSIRGLISAILKAQEGSE